MSEKEKSLDELVEAHHPYDYPPAPVPKEVSSSRPPSRQPKFISKDFSLATFNKQFLHTQWELKKASKLGNFHDFKITHKELPIFVELRWSPDDLLLAISANEYIETSRNTLEADLFRLFEESLALGSVLDYTLLSVELYGILKELISPLEQFEVESELYTI